MTHTAVQLYSLRNAISADLRGAVARVREIGYEHVEPYAFVERVDEYERAFADTGLTAPSGHAAVIDAEDAAPIFDAAKSLGMGIVIDPFIPTERWKTADDVAKIADRVNELTSQAARHGLRFGYHNHQWEFMNRVDGRTVYDLFVERLSPDTVLEVDTFWATVGGADAPALLRSLGDRVVAIHVKDGRIDSVIRDALPSSQSALVVPDALRRAFENQTPAGQGDVDVAAILAAAPHAIRVVEFDSYSGDVFDGIAQSLRWLGENDR